MQEISARNAWIAAAAAAQRRIPAWLAVAITVAIFAVTLYLSPIVTRLALSSGGHSVAAARSVSSICYFLPLYLVPLLLMKLVEHRPWPAARIGWIGFGLGFGAFGFLLALGLAGLCGAVVFVRASGLTPGLLASLAAAAAIIAFRTFAEEFVFRAWLQPLLAYRWGPWMGLAVTSILFGCVHVVRNFQPLGVLNVMLAGAFFGLLALRSGGLAASCGAHWIWNTLEQCVFGLSPNPGMDRMGSLLDFDLAGPALFSGGADAMNGSIATAVALGLCILVLARWERVARLRLPGAGKKFS